LYSIQHYAIQFVSDFQQVVDDEKFLGLQKSMSDEKCVEGLYKHKFLKVT